MDRIGSAQLKRLIRKYEYLLEDWEEVEEISRAANQEMSAELHKNKPQTIEASDFEIEEEESEPNEVNSDVPLKKLFRKIVVKCHPDKIGEDTHEYEKERLLNLYEKAVVAHDESNWALMVIVAIKLDVDLPEEASERVEQIKEETEKLEQKINSATSSISWQWYHSDSEARDKLIEMYLGILQKNKRAAQKKGTKLILGLGHPRTGTGYTAKLLQSWGLDVGHEVMGGHGTVDWTLAAGGKSLWQGVDFKDWNWQHKIYCVRDPRESIASIAYTEAGGPSFEFRKAKEMRVGNPNPIVSAIASIIKWDQLITQMSPNLVYNIESKEGAKKLFDYLQESGVEVTWNERFIGKRYNTREHKDFDTLLKEHGNIPNRFKRQINEYCKKYGYPELF